MVANLLSRAPTSVLLEPGAPQWAHRLVGRLTATFKLVNPQAPVRIWAANKADLPPASEWAGSLVWVTDQDCMGLSDGVSWRKISLGAPV